MMTNLFWLTVKQMTGLKPSFPKSHAGRRSACVERHYFHQSQWLAVVRCAERVWPAKDPLQPLKSMERQARLRPDDERSGVRGAVPKTFMIDATYLKALRTATSPR